jgi:glycosyltransferase involved in cell wall biosynthesis
LRVLYDHQIFEGQSIGGISRYFSELVARNPDSRVSAIFSDNVYLRGIPDYGRDMKPRNYHYDRFLLGAAFRGKGRLFNLYSRTFGRRIPTNKAASIAALKAGAFEVFHPTYYNPYFLEYLGRKPMVITIYDLIHEKFPELFGMNFETALYRKKLLERADAVITISENTKKDLVSLYSLNPADIDVVYLGSLMNKGEIKPLSLPGKYILYVGARDGYKNFGFFVWSIAEYLRSEKDLFLLCTGPAFSASEFEAFRLMGIEERVLHRFAAEDEMFSLYAGAECFVFPSYYEGFGLPILEAFEADCPVLLANASCFPEIAGNAAIYFDPKDRISLLDAIKEIRHNTALRKELACKGRRRLDDFSWDLTYERTMKVYERVAGR